MRIFAVTLLAVALAARAEAQVAAIPEAHVLLLDRNMLKSNDPALDNSFEMAVRDVESRIMARHRANLILDKSAAVLPGSIDVTAEAVAALTLAEPGWTPPQTVDPAQNVPNPIPPAHILVVDNARLGSPRVVTPGSRLSQALDKIAASRGASFILSRDIVVIGSPRLDVTALVATSSDERTGALPHGNGTDTPVARIAIIDRQAILRTSAVGQSIAAQVHDLVIKMGNDLRPESLSLKKEGELLQTDVANLEPDERERQIADFQQRRDAFAKKVRQGQDQLRVAVADAQKRVENVAGPIVQQLVKDSGANLVIDRSAVVVGENTLDMTSLAIARLNAAMHSVDLTLPPQPTK
jgi:Skp family chaperone for outer membrane proteins